MRSLHPPPASSCPPLQSCLVHRPCAKCSTSIIIQRCQQGWERCYCYAENVHSVCQSFCTLTTPTWGVRNSTMCCQICHDFFSSKQTQLKGQSVKEYPQDIDMTSTPREPWCKFICIPSVSQFSPLQRFFASLCTVFVFARLFLFIFSFLFTCQHCVICDRLSACYACHSLSERMVCLLR